MLSKISQSQKEKDYHSTYMWYVKKSNSQKNKQNGVYQWLGGREIGNCSEVQSCVLQDGEVLEIDCITMKLHLTLLNSLVNSGYIIYFIYIFDNKQFKMQKPNPTQPLSLSGQCVLGRDPPCTKSTTLPATLSIVVQRDHLQFS